MDRVDKVKVFFSAQFCGILEKKNAKYYFSYDYEYLSSGLSIPLSHSLPLQIEPFVSDQLFPFFAGLVAEGWLLRQQSFLEKVDAEDYLTLLAYNGEDLPGAVSVQPV